MKKAYERAGVRHLGKAKPSEHLVGWLRKTFDFRKRAVGEVQLDFGQYANVLKITDDLGVVVKTDGVGTKVLIAQMMDKYDTVGIDCVAMNVNDMICIGAEPIAMLDYLAVEEADPSFFSQITKGLYEGARQARISIPGGEVAQVRDLIKGARPGRAFDLVGFGVGTVALDKVITGASACPGDVLIGLASSGLHSNGYTLARKIIFEQQKMAIDKKIPALGTSIGEALLAPTKIYVPEAMDLLKHTNVKAMFHITGGGWLNPQRISAPVGFEITKVPEPPALFGLLQQWGKLSTAEMYSTFNMGIGLMAVISPEDVDSALKILERHKTAAWQLGKCMKGAEKKIVIKPKGLVGAAEKFVSDNQRNI